MATEIKMTNFAFTVAVLLASTMVLEAQDGNKQKSSSEKLYALGAVHFINRININEKLVSSGTLEINTISPSYGFGKFVENRKMVVWRRRYQSE